jgi:septal ring factor EnvC (AmiA/AmiB activator)
MSRPRTAAPILAWAMVMAVAMVLRGATVQAADDDATAPNKSDTAQQLQDIEKQIEEGKTRKQELTGKAEKIAKEADTLQHQLIETASQVQDLEVQVTALEDKIKDLSGQEAAKSKDLAARRNELSKLLAGLQRFGEQPTVTLIARPSTVIDTARTGLLLDRIIPTLADRARDVGQKVAAIRALRADIEMERVSLGQQSDALKAKRDEIDDLLAQKADERKHTLAEAKATDEQMTKLAAEATDLRSLIAKLEQQEEAQAALDRAAREAASRLGQPKPEQNQDVAALMEHPFSSVRGTLSLPAKGKIVALYGQDDENGVPRKGVVIATRDQAEVVAPYDGRIVFAGRFRHYGQLLIISHGEGYHTLLAGMSRIDGVVGQWVLAGEPLGQMGNSSSNGLPGSQPRLYVELRKQGEPINPLPWLAASERKVSG